MQQSSVTQTATTSPLALTRPWVSTLPPKRRRGHVRAETFQGGFRHPG